MYKKMKLNRNSCYWQTIRSCISKHCNQR